MGAGGSGDPASRANGAVTSVTDDEAPGDVADAALHEPPAQPSVFGRVDQDELIAHIGAVDEDLSSLFFEESLADAEDAAMQVFDIGIRLLAEDVGRLGDPGRSADPRPNPYTRGVHGRNPSNVTTTPVSLPGILSRDNHARRAFILGGPDAL